MPSLPDISADGRLRLSLATGAYDHVRDLTTGVVQAAGIQLIPQDLQIEEIFFRLATTIEWDISEFSFGKYVSLRSRDDTRLTAIPVFPSRVFRLSSFYVRGDGSITAPEQLAGKRIGIPEWSVTATVYARGYLMHDAGVGLADVEWVQGGVNEPGRPEKAVLNLPDGVRYRSVADRSLEALLFDGEIDAIICPRPPLAFSAGDPRIARLFTDCQSAEQAHYARTGIFPIMHTIVIRQEILDRYPWVAGNLMSAFETAKQRSLARARDNTASWYPFPWSYEAAASAAALIGEDFWPYGVTPNRATLEAFVTYAWEQGLCHRKLDVGELFPERLLASFLV
jgi:4,5-dihydroxyphthalate decarboxylase